MSPLAWTMGDALVLALLSNGANKVQLVSNICHQRVSSDMPHEYSLTTHTVSLLELLCGPLRSRPVECLRTGFRIYAIWARSRRTQPFSMT